MNLKVYDDFELLKDYRIDESVYDKIYSRNMFVTDKISSFKDDVDLSGSFNGYLVKITARNPIKLFLQFPTKFGSLSNVSGTEYTFTPDPTAWAKIYDHSEDYASNFQMVCSVASSKFSTATMDNLRRSYNIKFTSTDWTGATNFDQGFDPSITGYVYLVESLPLITDNIMIETSALGLFGIINKSSSSTYAKVEIYRS